jgi:phosphatidate cytidylyltransferase
MGGSLLFLAPLFLTGLAKTAPTVAGFRPLLFECLSLLGFLLLCAAAWVAVILLIRKGPEGLPAGLAVAGLILYLAFPLGSGLILLMTVPRGMLWLIVALMAPWFSDMFAYFTGSAIGSNPIVPQISPKKTVEGSLGGIAGSMLSLALFFYFFLRVQPDMPSSIPYNLLFSLASGLLLSVASQLGDWLASGVKRWSGIKDFGTIFPGHGGILDRFDSVLFTLPMTLFLAVIYLLLG